MPERNRRGNADGPAAEYHGVLSRGILPLSAGDHPAAADGKRLDQAGKSVGNAVIHRIQRVVSPGVGDENVFRKAADGPGTLCIAFGVARIGIHPLADRKVGHIFADLHHAGHGFVPEFAAYRDLVSGVGAVKEHGDIGAADARIEILHQHIVISDLRQRQLPQFDLFLS